MWRHQFSLLVRWRRTEIHVLVPLAYTQRNALVELSFVKPLGRGIHDADEFVVVAMFLVEQRRRMLGVEAEECFPGIPVVGEVIHLLRNFRVENLEAVRQGSAIVRVFLRGLARTFND